MFGHYNDNTNKQKRAQQSDSLGSTTISLHFFLVVLFLSCSSDAADVVAWHRLVDVVVVAFVVVVVSGSSPGDLANLCVGEFGLNVARAKRQKTRSLSLAHCNCTVRLLTCR